MNAKHKRATAISSVRNAMEVLGLHEQNYPDSDMDKTPKRFVRYLEEFHKPFVPEEVLGVRFKVPNSADRGMVIQRNVPFRMICAHHLLPAIGTATVGYIPKGEVVGLSKIPRLVDAIGTNRPSMQEDVTQRIVDALEHYLEPLGVMVVIKAQHMCMIARGVRAGHADTVTSKVTGNFIHAPQAREELLLLTNQPS